MPRRSDLKRKEKFNTLFESALNFASWLICMSVPKFQKHYPTFILICRTCNIGRLVRLVPGTMHLGRVPVCTGMIPGLFLFFTFLTLSGYTAASAITQHGISTYFDVVGLNFHFCHLIFQVSFRN